MTDDRPALVFWNEQGRQREVSYRELNQQVRSVAAALAAEGVAAGDRVAGFMPNLPETVIAMLGATSLGAIWSSCSPDFGANGVLDRFGQIQPKVLFCADGYRYAGKEIDSLARVREVRERIPEIQRVIVVPYLHEKPEISTIRDASLWSDWVNRPPVRPIRPSAFPSTTRSTSCIPPAPLVSPSAWFMGPEGRFCST